MNIKEFVVPGLIALLFTMSFQYLFLNKKTEVAAGEGKTGQSFIAPRTISEAKPLNLEVNFLGDKLSRDPVKTHVETPYANFIFSEEGASLEKLTFKEHQDESSKLMTTVAATDQTNREGRCFLLALDGLTPYYYRLVSEQKSDIATELIYEASSQQVYIQKKFIIHNNKHQIDLIVTIDPYAGSDNVLRIMYPSPFIEEIVKYDAYAALVINEKNSLEKILLKKIDSHRGWFAPVIFGTENKYFIHAMVNDPQHFVQRAYYKISCNSLISILEGAQIKGKKEWEISFYMGPKTDHAIEQVDGRLEGAIEHSGLLAPLSRLLLYILKFLHHYLHNYGIAIIVLTMLLKLVLVPFSFKSKASFKKQAEFQKKLTYIQQRYKDEPELLARERADLIRKYGMPGLGAMVPMLLQFPIFIALNRVLSSSIEMYKSSFLWIPDLSGYDPYYILAFLVTLSMIINALWAEPKQRISLLAFGLVFGAIAANFSAGLALFVFINTAMTTAQTIIQGKAS